MSNRLTRGDALVGSLSSDDDVTAADDLIVGDDANVAGNLSVTGDLTAGGTIDLGSPVTNIADPTGGDPIDSEARTAINSILDALEAVGIMAEAE